MTTEFSKILDVETLLAAAKPIKVAPVKKNLAALAKRVDVLDVKAFSTTFTATNEGPGIIRLDGNLDAKLVQQCARTLEEMETAANESFSLLLMCEHVADQYLAEQEEEVLEDIEILDDDTVDLGEIATQYLSLAIDRFPMKEGAVLKAPGDENVNVVSEVEDRAAKNPFAVLKDLDKKG